MKTNVTDKAMIFRKDYQMNDGSTFTKYTTSMGKKKQDGTFENAYLFVRFRKGVDVANKTQILIKEGWLTFDKWKKGDKEETSWGIFVSDFDILDANPDGYSALVDEDIPF